MISLDHRLCRLRGREVFGEGLKGEEGLNFGDGEEMVVEGLPFVLGIQGDEGRNAG